MKKIEKELKDKLDKITRIYTFAQEIYFLTEYLHKPETEEELDFVVNSVHSSKLRFIMHLMYRVLISEVAKLFSHSDSDKYRIDKFINSFAADGHFRKIGISSQKVQYWQTQLNAKDETINKVLLLRHKLYAHTDNPLQNYNDIDASFKEIKNLLDFVAEITQYAHKEALDTKLITDPILFNRKKVSLLSIMAKGEKQRLDDNIEETMNFIRRYNNL